jgi:hypothetical protein
MATLGGTMAGWTFFAATAALFGWGLHLGVRGLMAGHPPFRRGAKAPEGARRPGFDAA